MEISCTDFKSKYIIVMRHAERADCAYKKCTFEEDDTELSTLGDEQSIDIGLQLKEFCETKNIPVLKSNVTVISSPFSRTIMTASKVLEGLGVIEEFDNFYLCNGLGEYLNEWQFTENPFNVIAVNNKESVHYQTLSENYLSAMKPIKWIEKSLDSEVGYPESASDNQSRYTSTFYKLVDNFIDLSETRIFVISTHGYGVLHIEKYIDYNTNSYSVDYCQSLVIDFGPEGCNILTTWYPRIKKKSLYKF